MKQDKKTDSVEVVKICECGKPLIALFNKEGKRIGVTHDTYENEDYHNDYFSTAKCIERMKNN